MLKNCQKTRARNTEVTCFCCCNCRKLLHTISPAADAEIKALDATDRELMRDLKSRGIHPHRRPRVRTAANNIPAVE